MGLQKLLLDQTRTSSETRGSQVVTITHCPSLAAMADRHIVVQKLRSKSKSESAIEVAVLPVDGKWRYKELARMASGDLATPEAEAFAQALLRVTSETKQ